MKNLIFGGRSFGKTIRTLKRIPNDKNCVLFVRNKDEENKIINIAQLNNIDLSNVKIKIHE